MKHFKGVSTWLLVVLVTTGLALTGCAVANPKPGEVFPCVAEGKLDKTVAPEAELAEFSCLFKRWEGADTLHFKVGVKNVSDKPQRFRVHIFLDNDKAVGGLIPPTTKEGLVEPGQTGSFVYPVKGMSKKANAVTLRISTIGQ